MAIKSAAQLAREGVNPRPVDCPACHAKAGRRCGVNANGFLQTGKYGTFHTDRYFAAEEVAMEIAEVVSTCPACGDTIDYCQGHGETGDPWGFAILESHDSDDHTHCHPDGCEVLREVAHQWLGA